MSEDGEMLSADICCLSKASSNGGCMISGGEVCSGSLRGADPYSGTGLCPVLGSGGSELASGALSGSCEVTVLSGKTHLLSCAVKSFGFWRT